MTTGTVLAVTEPSQAGQARRTVLGIAQNLGFSEELAGRAALVATELAMNLALHARQGELILRLLEHENVPGIELLTVDRGPGMTDVDRCLADGFSTGGTAGKGLGAIRRMAHLFDVHSVPGKGTVVLAQVWGVAEAPNRPERRFDLGVVSLPKPGEEAVGDGWACHQNGENAWFMVVDGLGHGLPASTAARAAEEAFLAHPEWPPAEQMHAFDRALRSTRGAAASVVQIDGGIGRVRYAGVGNIAAAAQVSGRIQRMVSLNGTLGHVLPRVQEFQYEWASESLLVMHSDGLGTSWKLEAYSGLTARHPSVIAGTLYRDYARGRDDVTVLVARDRRTR